MDGILHIGICDDQAQIMDQLEKSVDGYLAKRSIACQIHRFSTPSEVYAYMKNRGDGDGGHLKLLFMDLQFESEEEDGAMWTKMIHDAWPGTLVMILTAYENRYKDGYRARAFRFMTKPLIRREFEENMDDCLRELGEVISVYTQKNQCGARICAGEILYIKTFAESTIYTKEKRYDSDKSLADWEEELKDCHFYRIHRSYLINLAYVTDISANGHEVFLEGQIRLPVSRRKWSDFKDCYIKFDVSGRK